MPVRRRQPIELLGRHRVRRCPSSPAARTGPRPGAHRPACRSPGRSGPRGCRRSGGSASPPPAGTPAAARPARPSHSSAPRATGSGPGLGPVGGHGPLQGRVGQDHPVAGGVRQQVAQGDRPVGRHRVVELGCRVRSAPGGRPAPAATPPRRRPARAGRPPPGCRAATAVIALVIDWIRMIASVRIAGPPSEVAPTATTSGSPDGGASDGHRAGDGARLDVADAADSFQGCAHLPDCANRIPAVPAGIRATSRWWPAP